MSWINNWPKQIPSLSAEQEKAREAWMKLWHEKYLTNNFSFVDKFNHEFVAKQKIPMNCKTLEIGAGLGEHLAYENLNVQDYHCLEYRENFANEITKKYPQIKIICGDIQQKQNFTDHYFDRIIAIHVLEHLPKLPDALDEIQRLIKPNGFFDIVLPTEGGLAYHLARQMTSARLFKKNFGLSYTPIMKVEHINTYDEIKGLLLEKGWKINNSSFFPFKIPYWHFNFCIGYRLQFKSLSNS